MECGVAQLAAAANERAGTRAAIARAQAGDYGAFDTLLEPRIEPLLRVATVIVGNDADARDATQNACVQAWRELPRLRDPDRFDAWLGRIVTNACRTILRQRRRQVIRELPIESLGETALGGSVVSTRPSLDGLGEQDALDRAFDRLHPDARAILVLHHLEDRSIAEIAGVLGLSSTTIKWRLVVARRAFRRALEVEWR